MDEQINTIKNWLGVGSINVFGLPFAGKDTQGNRLAEMFGGAMISSGDILRHNKDNKELQRILDAGEIIPSDLFEQIVVPYFSRSDIKDKPLILSEVGRVEGEQIAVDNAAIESGHPQKAVILLKLSDDEVYKRLEAAKAEHDRGERGDDRWEVLHTRLENYHEKVMPIIEWYRQKGLLVEVDGSLSRDEVTAEILESLADKANNA